MGTNVLEMFRVVSEGRLFTGAGFAWACPECGAVLAESRCRDARDRRALAHCLYHRDFRAALEELCARTSAAGAPSGRP